MVLGNILFIIILIVVGVLAGALVVLLRRLRDIHELQKHDELFHLLNQNIQGLHGRLDKNTEIMGTRLDKAAENVAKLAGDLGRLQELGRGLKDFQDFLRTPKLRGTIGEQVLRDLLEQCFPRDRIGFQHQFRSGTIVDAILKTDQGIIPLDAKFPMENFQRYVVSESAEDEDGCRKEFLKDVRKHIRDIASKYIQPSEGTVDYAVMYIPNEQVYYELLRNPNEDVIREAAERRVMVVSPNSFYYFLRVLMVAMEGKKIEETSREILRMLQGIQQDAKKFDEVLSVVDKHIGYASGAMDRAQREFARLSTKIEQTRVLEGKPAEPLLEENP